MRSPSELEKMLWKSAEADAPPKDGAERLSAALVSRLEAASSNVAPPASASSAAPVVAAASTYAVWKLVVSVVVLAVPLAVAVVTFRSTPPAPARPEPIAALDLRPKEQAASIAVPSPETDAPAVSVLSIDDLPPARSDRAPTARRPAAPPAPAPVSPERPADGVAAVASPTPPSPPVRASDLDAEVAALDAVRDQLRAGVPARATTLLGQYEARFPRGLLRPEAKVLQIEASAASGEKARAHELALSFLQHYPNDSHAERIRRLEAQLRP